MQYIMILAITKPDDANIYETIKTAIITQLTHFSGGTNDVKKNQLSCHKDKQMKSWKLATINIRISEVKVDRMWTSKL